MAKKGTAVVLGGTSNHSFAMGTFLLNLKDKAPNLADEVVLFHDGKMTALDKKVIEKIYPTRFIAYDFPIQNRAILRNSSIGFFSKMVFTKYECLRLLEDYHTVIWSDYDVVLLDTIAEVATPCSSGVRMILRDEGVKYSLSRPIPEYDMDAWGVSSALIVFHDSLAEYRRMYEFCYQKTAQYLLQLHLPEQAIFGILLQEFSLQPEPIDFDIYSCHPDQYASQSDAKILHAYGATKFWNGLEHAEWEKNYARWLSMGGSQKETAFQIWWRNRRLNLIKKMCRILWRQPKRGRNAQTQSQL